MKKHSLEKAEGRTVVTTPIPAIHYGFDTRGMFSNWPAEAVAEATRAYRQLLTVRISSAIRGAKISGLVNVEVTEMPRAQSRAQGLDGTAWLQVCVEQDEALRRAHRARGVPALGYGFTRLASSLACGW